MSEKIIGIGAEAVLIHNGEHLIKRRISKGYRHPELDNKIRKLRTRSEGKLLHKAEKIIPIPKIHEIREKDFEIDMDFEEGKKLSEYLDKFSEKQALEICKIIGKNIALIHNADLIHGDLTTSNMIYNESEKKLFFIDFGLGFHSKRIEDKAVDLHLLKQALESKHFQRFKEYLLAVHEGYKENSKDKDKTFEQLKKVESRGRYKGKH